MRTQFARHKQVIQLVAVVLFLAATLLALKSQGLLSQWEHLITDSLYVPAAVPKQITVVGIDEASLSKIGAWPWDRSVFAGLIDKLDAAGVRVAAFDVTFFESRSGDARLLESLRQAKMQVVLAGKLEDNQFLTPLAEFLALPNVHTGYVNLFEDSDNKIRDTSLVKPSATGNVPSFAYRALLAYFGINTDPDFAKPLPQLGFTSLPPGNELIINYLGGKGSVNNVSLQGVLDGTVDTAGLKDQLVFIGSTVQDLKFGLDDNLIAPTGLMPGVEIHANVASTVINSRVILPLDPTIEAGILVVVGAVALGLILGVSLLGSVVTIAVMVVIYMLAMVLMFGSGYMGDFLYTPLLLILIALTGICWRYLGKLIENLGLKRAFSQYVNDQLLAEILKDPSKLKLGGERRDMTVFFSDIRGFTTISERLDAEKLVEFLNVYLTKATDKILNHRGVVDKYLGDAIMALWGAPLSDPHHALNSCLAALDILVVLEEFNKDSAIDIPKLQIGIGINTGDMVVGNMGSERRFDYTVMGDNVNLASRLEGLTKKYHCAIILGEGVARELEATGDAHRLLYRHVDTVTVKGKEKPVKLYELLALAGVPEQTKLQEMSGAYAAALSDYIAGRFAEAHTAFAKVAADFSDDVAAAMAERCAELQASEQSWKGYWAWDSK